MTSSSPLPSVVTVGYHRPALRSAPRLHALVRKSNTLTALTPLQSEMWPPAATSRPSRRHEWPLQNTLLLPLATWSQLSVRGSQVNTSLLSAVPATSLLFQVNTRPSGSSALCDATRHGHEGTASQRPGLEIVSALWVLAGSAPDGGAGLIGVSQPAAAATRSTRSGS